MLDYTLISFRCAKVVFKISRLGGWNGTFSAREFVGGGG